MKPITNTITELLKVDPVAQAEEITGCRIGDTLHNPTASLSFALMHKKNEELQGALLMQDDTTMRTSWKDCKRIIESEGFEIVLIEKFHGSSGVEEEFIIAWHPDGILIKAESYSGRSMNTGSMYYNIKGDGHELCKARSTGSFPRYNSEKDGEPSIMEGNHDIREAFRHNLASLRAVGRFMRVWHTRPFLWLLTYMDTKPKDYDFKAINASRIARLPNHIQEAIKGQQE